MVSSQTHSLDDGDQNWAATHLSWCTHGCFQDRRELGQWEVVQILDESLLPDGRPQ